MPMLQMTPVNRSSIANWMERYGSEIVVYTVIGLVVATMIGLVVSTMVRLSLEMGYEAGFADGSLMKRSRPVTFVVVSSQERNNETVPGDENSGSHDGEH